MPILEYHASPRRREVRLSIARWVCSLMPMTNTGHPDKAEACFLDATHISTLSGDVFKIWRPSWRRRIEIDGKPREMGRRGILQKKPNMPNYLRRRERPWLPARGQPRPCC
jgi:hypothetical protein